MDGGGDRGASIIFSKTLLGLIGFGVPGTSAGLGTLGSATSKRFLRPKETPQLLAKSANRLLAVAPLPVGLPAPKNGLDAFNVVDNAVAGFRGETWYEVVRRRCAIILAMPSVGDPSGEGTREPCDVSFRSPRVSVEGEAAAIACSDVAVVATALTTPDAPPRGIRPPENREDVEMREPLDPGRREDGPCGPEIGGTDPVCDGDGGGCGEAAGDGDRA